MEYHKENKSFSMIANGAPFGIYQYIDENVNIVFNKKEN